MPNIFTILNILGILLVFTAGMLLFPLAIAVYFKEGDINAISLSILIGFVIGMLLWRGFKKQRGAKKKDGFIIVTLGWVVISSLSALPFMIHGSIPSFTDAFFEVMSGYTTTGATILTDIEKLPHGLLLWRSMTHFIGGMGIIMLALIIISLPGMGNTQLYQAEG
ncbi:MAG: TrkH family potassium uptake protein, partial [SAR324 cluster bacterium]|nr:TrkH family potassium uptake protein [SAR324 cluster bacterium]